MTNENRLGHTHNFLEKFRLHLIIVQRESQFKRCHSLSTFPPKKKAKQHWSLSFFNGLSHPAYPQTIQTTYMK